MSSAVSKLHPFSIQEVVATLSLREYCKLCDLVDAMFGKTVTEVSNAGTLSPLTAKRKTVVKFDVLAIDRLEVGKSWSRLRWMRTGQRAST